MSGKTLALILCLSFAGLVCKPFAIAERPMVAPGEFVVTRRADKDSARATILSFKSENRRPQRYYRRNNRCREILAQDSSVFSCMPNFIVKAIAGDPYVFPCSNSNDCNWGVDNSFDTDLDLPQAWEISDGSPDVIVAVLDTGLDLSHPDITDNIWTNTAEIPSNGIDDDSNGFIDDVHGANMTASGPPFDDNGHGTHVAGIIAALRNNSIGIAGAAPEVKILPIKILAANGAGSIANAIAGIDYVTALAARGEPIVVFNNSWGGYIPSDQIGPLIAAFTRAETQGVLATMAAGNGTVVGSRRVGDNIDNLSFYPAKISLSTTLTVAATNITGRIAGFSNFGSNSVHIAAPGEDIRSLLSNGAPASFGRSRENGTTVLSGTSMATPFVSGVLALMKSAVPALSNVEIRDRLLARVYALPADESVKVISGGRVNALYALNDEIIPEPTPLATFTPTMTPTVTATPTITPTLRITPTPSATAIVKEPLPTQTPSGTVDGATKVKFSLKALPIDSFSSLESSGVYFLSAKSTNLIEVAASQNTSFLIGKLSVSNQDCPLIEQTLSQPKTYFTLSLLGQAKRLRSLQFTITAGGETTITSALPVRNFKRGNLKISCAKLRRKVQIK